MQQPIKPENQWSCKRSPDIWVWYKHNKQIDEIWPCRKIGQGHSRVIYINFLYGSCQIFKTIGLLVPKKNIFKGLGNIWACRPSWSSANNHLYRFMSPFPNEAPHKTWYQRSCLKSGHIHVYIPGTGSANLFFF